MEGDGLAGPVRGEVRRGGDGRFAFPPQNETAPDFGPTVTVAGVEAEPGRSVAEELQGTRLVARSARAPAPLIDRLEPFDAGGAFARHDVLDLLGEGGTARPSVAGGWIAA
ncbi:hypothetical protein MPTK2_1g24310 [Marchantia polymorpha subsp. ruderalis]